MMMTPISVVIIFFIGWICLPMYFEARTKKGNKTVGASSQWDERNAIQVWANATKVWANASKVVKHLTKENLNNLNSVWVFRYPL